MCHFTGSGKCAVSHRSIHHLVIKKKIIILKSQLVESIAMANLTPVAAIKQQALRLRNATSTNICLNIHTPYNGIFCVCVCACVRACVCVCDNISGTEEAL